MKEKKKKERLQRVFTSSRGRGRERGVRDGSKKNLKKKEEMLQEIVQQLRQNIYIINILSRRKTEPWTLKVALHLKRYTW